MEPLWAIARGHATALVLGHSFLWILGLSGIALGARRLRHRIRERDQAEKTVMQANQQLEAVNQQLVASEQQLRAANQQLTTSEQQLRATNQQLKASEERFRDFFANASVGFHIFGPDRIIADINETELAMIDYTRDEVVGKKTWADLIIPEQRGRFEKHWQDIITKG